ncbi:general substrate transporter [Lanmaoa asiatica]|nr:general substrate transporter [Lanmaoa asiatica]
MPDPAPPSSRHRLVGQPLLYAISVFASLGVFLFGYDQGSVFPIPRLCLCLSVPTSVMSGIITGPYFRQFFNSPGPLEVGTMVAVLELGALGVSIPSTTFSSSSLEATSIAAGRVGDIVGRKGTLFVGAFVFTIGGAVQTFTTGFYVMIIGRVISGFGVGLLSTIVPIYQSEISPPNHASTYLSHFKHYLIPFQRGALACMEFTGNIAGYATSVWTDYFCSFLDSHLSWRIPLFIQCVIGAILAVGSLVMPESPRYRNTTTVTYNTLTPFLRWLIDTDQDAAGMRVIVDLHGGDPNDILAQAEFQEIKEKVVSERELGEGRAYSTMWRKYKRRVLLAMSSQAFAQLVRRSFQPSTMIDAGWLGRDAVLMTGINAIIYLLSTIPPWYLVDRWGRRFILLSGAIIMGIALGLTGWWMYIDIPATPQAVVACVIIFNAAFGYSWGPIPWLYPPEIMPLTFRSKGVSISTATNWSAPRSLHVRWLIFHSRAFNFIVGETTPYLQEVITWRLYPMHGFYCACSFILVYFLYPETKGVPLEEMDAVFGEGESVFCIISGNKV